MADGFTVDTSQVDQLAADMGRNIGQAAGNIRKAVEVTARNIKDQTRGKLTGTWKALAPAVQYDIDQFVGGTQAVVGYEKSVAAGPLGNIREYGAPGAHRTVVTVRDGKRLIIPTAGRLARPPHNDLEKALADNQADFVRGLEKALGDL